MKNSILISVVILSATLSTHSKNLENTSGTNNCQESYCFSVFNLSLNTLSQLWKIGNDQIFKIKEEKVIAFFESNLSSDRAEPDLNQSTNVKWNYTNSLKTQAEIMLNKASQMIKKLLGL